ncbi:MAG: UDP-N-acetylmuramoyl-tripeptide--D-alanyl-D-alanine ligase, partial [Armatimonadetes bacterium]|nr:UDP-N-acetylmuramoyl-tripeptide--D-alanyl-D-alanine ligase [Armatimonadota bacterium]NIM24699.1 UDP-N-acetylmuramoyl-tripeptide--D-alanyl-D-alanine ligase [Armatimonadota bacterium]NIM68579.1 UDP-N-acetylmuramoyl-tripeptide--D-alanyl-D-alanine ligase [Armatimonadota bacterium]NIM77096.1 UDP-N-acetylmuramoyl-tripeptide--D-alanyl-D-alanine ligase [Armatimonadota bacterium]NIN06773.1 UDP-N-acetylmuramoyl-tripeptide--D-alanyl-D-alanine ligase [Armatimonadota bacterium]
MMSIVAVKDIVGATLLQGEAEGEVTGVSTDTRALRAGELFIALRGEKFDGHDFLSEAFRKGAAAAIVSASPKEPVEGCLLLVKDTLPAMGTLAAHWRRKFDLPVVAVTGSVGKTTTKEMIASILAQTGEVLKTPENYNNEIGVPLTVFNLTSNHKAAVFELAMRGRGQIRYLAEIISPHVGVITNIGISHLELLSGPEAIAEAKA